jgi:hypothetical protein
MIIFSKIKNYLNENLGIPHKFIYIYYMANSEYEYKDDWDERMNEFAKDNGMGQRINYVQQMSSSNPMDTKQVLGIQYGTFKQGILNAIGRWNSASRASNLLQGKFLKGENKIDYDAMREGRIKQALKEVLEMPNLGKYGISQAFGDALLVNNVNQYMVSKQNMQNKVGNAFGKFKNMMGFNKTQGGKKRKMRKTRKNNRK